MRKIILAGLLTAFLTGCIIFDKKSEAVAFHQLSAPQIAPTRIGPVIFVPRAIIPSSLRRANVVMLDEAGWVRVEDAHRWINPLDRAIAETIGHHLTKLTGLPSAVQSPAGAHLTLLVDVNHMSVTANKQAVLEIRFRLESAEGTLLLEKAIIQSSAMGETTPEQYVRAQSANLAAATATFSQLLPAELKLAR
jgi:uncharacterized lipoprotein YmbA